MLDISDDLSCFYDYLCDEQPLPYNKEGVNFKNERCCYKMNVFCEISCTNSPFYTF